MRFYPAPEYQVFPTRERPLKPYEAVVRAVARPAQPRRASARTWSSTTCSTLAPALAAELEGARARRSSRTSIPPPAPACRRTGSARCRRAARRARGCGGRSRGPPNAGVERGRRELNETRRRVGLPQLDPPYGGISADLCMVGDLPAARVPAPVAGRRARDRAADLGAARAATSSWPPATAPRVLVAPSTSQDPDQRLLRAARSGLASLPVRVLAVAPPRRPAAAGAAPNARSWTGSPIEQAMPHADLVVCHAGHGTLATALAGGAPVVTVPAAGDMAENGARAQWAGAGLNLPGRFLSARTLRWTVARALERPALGARARELAGWARTHDGAEAAAGLVERFAATRACRS